MLKSLCLPRSGGFGSGWLYPLTGSSRGAKTHLALPVAPPMTSPVASPLARPKIGDAGHAAAALHTRAVLSRRTPLAQAELLLREAVQSSAAACGMQHPTTRRAASSLTKVTLCKVHAMRMHMHCTCTTRAALPSLT